MAHRKNASALHWLESEARSIACHEIGMIHTLSHPKLTGTCGVGIIIIPMSYMRTLKLRELNNLPPGPATLFVEPSAK